MLQVSEPNSERRGRPKRPSSAISMLGSFSSRVSSIGGLSARVTPTNSNPASHGYCIKPHQAFQAPTPSEDPPFGGKMNPNHANSSPRSPMMLASSDNAVTKVNGEHGEVIPKVSPSAFKLGPEMTRGAPRFPKLGPEVPRTIYPGLDDFLPECDGETLFSFHDRIHSQLEFLRIGLSFQELDLSQEMKTYLILLLRLPACERRSAKHGRRSLGGGLGHVGRLPAQLGLLGLCHPGKGWAGQDPLDR